MMRHQCFILRNTNLRDRLRVRTKEQESARKLCAFFRSSQKNTVTNVKHLERMYVARQSHLIKFQSLDDH